MSDIVFKNVEFSYPSGYTAVENINLTIKQNENVAIIGQNGAGKTTTVKMMDGLLKPTKGDVMVGDKNTKNFTIAQISRLVGYVFQNPDDQIFHSTVDEEVRYGPKSLKLSLEEENKRVEYALKLTGMDEYKDINPLDLPLSTRKFVTIASVIAMDTEVVILDEPTAGQDIDGNIRLANIITKLHESGKTLVTISHDMEFVANNFKRIIVMATKHIVREGEPHEIFWDFDSLAKAKLKQPYVSRICRNLKVPGNIINIDEAVEGIMKHANGNQK